MSSKKRYKHCVLLVSREDVSVLKKSVDCLTNAEEFSNTLVLAVMQDGGRKPYELDREDLDVFISLAQPNVRRMSWEDTGLAEAFAEMERYGCEHVLLIEAGDTFEACLLRYCGIFFSTPANRERCGVLLPRINADTKIPEDGICRLAERNALPESLQGAILLRTSIDCGTVCGKALTEQFREQALRSVLQKGAYGLVNAAYFGHRQDEEEVKRLLVTTLTAKSLKLPQNVRNWLKEWALTMPLQNPDVNTERTGTAPKPAFCGQNAVGVTDALRITELRNVRGDLLLSLSAPSAYKDVSLRVKASTELLAWDKIDCGESETEGETRYRALVTLKNMAVKLRFYENDKPLSFLTLPEEAENYQVNFSKGELSVEKIAARANYEVSVIIPVYNKEKSLEEAVRAVIGQSEAFYRKIQIVLIDDGSTDGSTELCEQYAKKYPYNVTFVRQTHRGVSAARNSGLERAMGDSILFLDADDMLEPGLLQTGLQLLEEHPEIGGAAFPLRYFGNITNDIFDNNERYITDRNAQFDKDGTMLRHSACGVLIRAKLAKKHRFDTALHFSEDAAYMHKIVHDTLKIIEIDKPYYLYRKDMKDQSAMGGRYSNPDWYAKFALFGDVVADHSLTTWGYITRYTKHLIIHDLLDALTPHTLPPFIDYQTVLRSISSSLCHSDEAAIWETEGLPLWYRLFLLELKQGAKLTLQYTKEGIWLQKGEYQQCIRPELHIQSLQEQDGLLRVRATFSLAPKGDYALIARCKDTEYEADLKQKGQEYRIFGQSAHKDAEPVWELKRPLGNITFYLHTEENDTPLSLIFHNKAGLSRQKGAFYVGVQTLIYCGEKENELVAENISNDRLVAFWTVFSARFPEEKRLKAQKLVNEFLQLRPMIEKTPLWLIMDDGNKAGYNRALYQYCTQKQDGIDKYYIMKPLTAESLLLTEEDASLVSPGSEKHILLYLMAQKIFFSQPEEQTYNPLVKEGLEEILAGFCNGELLYLPGDSLVNDETQTLRSCSRRIRTVLCAEQERVLLPPDLRPSAIVAGSPKYDVLRPKKTKQILFMPSWRPSLYMGEGKLNPHFAASEYCRNICELLCSEELMSAAEDHGFTFCYAPHPKTFLQIEDIEMDEIVEVIIPGQSRELLAENTALLITDCVAAQDFARLGRPVLYYRFTDEWPEKENIPRFGEEYRTLKDLTKAVIAYMQRDLAPTEEDKRRVKEYFASEIGENCERIYGLLHG